MFLSKLYRQMYAGTGISTDSARRKKSKAWAKWTAKQCKKLFQATPMPELASPMWEIGLPAMGQAAFAGGACGRGAVCGDWGEVDHLFHVGAGCRPRACTPFCVLSDAWRECLPRSPHDGRSGDRGSFASGGMRIIGAAAMCLEDEM